MIARYVIQGKIFANVVETSPQVNRTAENKVNLSNVFRQQLQ